MRHNGWLRVLAVLVPLALSGCLSSEGLYEDVHTSRVSAYQTWQGQRSAERASETLLKGQLSLQDSLKVALVQNKQLQAALEEKEVARGQVVASYSEVLPKLTAVANYTRLDKVSSFDVGGQSVALGFENNYSADLVVSQPIFRGGAISAAIRASRLFAYLSDESVRGQVQQTIYEVARTYYDALLAQELYAVNEDAVKSAEIHLEDVKRKRGEGIASQFDVLRAEVDLSNFRAEMIQQLNRIHLSKTRLLKTMGVSQDSDVKLTGELTYEPMKPVLEEAVRLAHMNRPDLYQAELGVRLEQEALTIAKSRYWPSVDAVFTQGWSRPDPHTSSLDKWGDVWTAGVTASWPIFDGLAREGRVIQERAKLKKSKIELLDAQERALLEVQQAILSLRDAEEFVESQRQSSGRAEEGLRLAQVGYREGINTEVEVADARAALTRAKGFYYQAVYSHNVARLDLQRAMGILGPRAGETGPPVKSQPTPGHIEEFVVPKPEAGEHGAEKDSGQPQDNQGDK